MNPLQANELRIGNQIQCALDDELFVCNKCRGNFKATDGTWLPVGYEDKSKPLIAGEQPKVIQFGNFLQPPEVITSDEFTCYECVGDFDFQSIETELTFKP